MTDKYNYRTISLRNKPYSRLEKLSNIVVKGEKLSIPKTIELVIKAAEEKINNEEVNMLTKAKIDKALDAFYWGDTGPNAKDKYTSGYKLLHQDEDTINIIGEVLHTLVKKENK